MIYPDFPGWKKFLGTKYQTWQEASAVCISLKVKSPKDYKKVWNFRTGLRDSKLPQHPDIFYEDFPGWKNFLGFKSPPKGWVEWDKLVKENGSSFEFSVKIHDIIERNPEIYSYFWKEGRAVKYVLYSAILPKLEMHKINMSYKFKG